VASILNITVENGQESFASRSKHPASIAQALGRIAKVARNFQHRHPHIAAPLGHEVHRDALMGIAILTPKCPVRFRHRRHLHNMLTISSSLAAYFRYDKSVTQYDFARGYSNVQLTGIVALAGCQLLLFLVVVALFSGGFHHPCFSWASILCFPFFVAAGLLRLFMARRRYGYCTNTRIKVVLWRKSLSMTIMTRIFFYRLVSS